jgi:hypothetical protein
MLIDFFQLLRSAGIRPGLDEWMDFLRALKAGVASDTAEDFYRLARLCLVKDETQFDRFDQVFKAYFQAVESIDPQAEIPEEWLRKQAEKILSEAEKARMQESGDWEALMQRLRDQLAKQDHRHQGGNRAIGTAGTSPFGAWGYNPEGVRIGQDYSRHRRAVKVWDKRDFANLDPDRALGARNLQMALRRLRRFTRDEGAADELDLSGTIRSTARNAGLLDLQWRRPEQNQARLLVLFDVGGSMDDHIARSEQLFHALRNEFRQLEYFYFHNCPYERLWRDNRRRGHAEPTEQVLQRFDQRHGLLLVGDASMSPFELAYPGGSVEHWNAESGAWWLQRLFDHFPRAAWLNPVPEQQWSRTPTIEAIQELIGQRMFGLTPQGVGEAADCLKKARTTLA